MRELVGGHELDLPRAASLQQRVEQDDAAGSAQARDVRVALPRPPARVGDEHALDRNARALGQRSQLPRQVGVGERAKAVEDRLEDDRREEADDEHERARRGRGGQRPPARERACEPHQPDHRDGGQHRADGDRLGPVGGPSAHGLRRQAEPVLVHVTAPERERKPDERRRDDDDPGQADRL
jgi:hypothetical protein